MFFSFPVIPLSPGGCHSGQLVPGEPGQEGDYPAVHLPHDHVCWNLLLRHWLLDSGSRVNDRNEAFAGEQNLGSVIYGISSGMSKSPACALLSEISPVR